MRKETLDEVLACLPKERTLFHYYKGQYACYLMAKAAQQLGSIRDIKSSRFQSLLNHNEIKPLLAKQGGGKLCGEVFVNPWKKESKTFLLTADRWGNHNNWNYQTTRKGCNLVLQLNFSEQHNRAYHRLVKPEDEFLFNYYGHPVMEKEKRELFRETLAWARIDFDLETGEALIEEIQSDWVRQVKSCLRGIKNGRTPWLFNWCDCSTKDFTHYAENIMAPFDKLWAEAMLTAAIQFIVEELGITNIYYHSHRTGGKVKGVFGEPPRSLYSDLPRKFCFKLTHEDPQFIANDRFFKRKKRSLKQVAWYQLQL